MTINRCHGYLVSQITACLSNMHIDERVIWITRHGESEDNRRQLLGGDSPLTDAGKAYARQLAAFIADKRLRQLMVWTSTLVRTKDTVRPLLSVPFPDGVVLYDTPLLNEIDAGVCEGWCAVTQPTLASRALW